jgi:tetratricopeptide (TPR) repeat protein
MVALTKKEKLLASAQKLLLKGQIPKAIKEYEQVVKIGPNDVRSRLKLAELYNRSKMSAKAIEEYRKIGEYYSDNGFHLKAIAVFKQAQRIDSSDPQIYHTLAELNVKQGLIGNALAEYRALVTFYENQQNPQDAIKILQKMKDLEPENLNIRVKLAEAYAKQDRRTEALEDFQAVLKVLQRKNLSAKILKLCEIFSGFFPDEGSLKIALGQALIQGGEAAKGISVLSPFLEQSPDNAAIARSLAQAYAEIGNHHKAQDIYSHLLENIPGDLDLREQEIQAFLDGDGYLSALKILEETKGAFLEANRIPKLKTFYEFLRERLPEEERIAATLHAIYAASGEGGQLPDITSAETLRASAEPETSAEVESEYPGTDSGLEPEILCEEPPIELKADAQDDALEEIPLAFLEGASLVQEKVGSEPAEEITEYALELELNSPFADLSAVDSEVPTGQDVLTFDEEELSLSFDGDENGVDLSALEALPDFGEDVSAGEVDLMDLNDVTTRIEEAGFYLTQGLFDEAKSVCSLLLEASPHCHEAKELLHEIESRRSQEGEKLREGQAEFVDFTEDDFSEIEFFGPSTGSAPDTNDRSLLEEQPSQVKRGVDEQIDPDDAESHYNLGIAYREMGLINDAIGQFDQAMKNVRRRIDCLTLKGICLVDKKNFAEAESVFKIGLSTPDLVESQKISLFFEMGLLYEAWGRPLDALDSFQSVADIDLFFRNVQDMIHKLRDLLGMQEGKDNIPGGGTGGKNRVSYV